jgi:hypothetical protein
MASSPGSGSSKRAPMFEDLLETREDEDQPRFDAAQ